MGAFDEFDSRQLDEAFIRGGVHEPAARTRAAIGRYGTEQSSWRQAAPLQPVGAMRPAHRPVAHNYRARSPRRVTFFRPSPIFFGLVAATVTLGYLLWIGHGTRYGAFAFVLSGWMVSLCLHEFGHAAVGLHGGDASVVDKGYMRLDPRRYQHPLLSFVIPVAAFALGGIGFPGGAVHIDRSAIRSRHWRAAMSLAGPAFNVACGLVCLAPFALGLVTPQVWIQHVSFFAALALLAALELSSAVLCLLPIPGLDGWGAIEPYVDPQVARDAHKVPQGVMLMGLFALLSVPAFSRLIWWIPLQVAAAAGVHPGLISFGWHLVHFWHAAY